MGRRITAAEAAARLGVKRETLYAYVSRGMLGSERQAGGRESTFDAAEVDALGRRARRGGRAGSLEVVVASAITAISEDRLHYRGLDVAELARAGVPFEAVAEFLWGGDGAVLDGPAPAWPAVAGVGGAGVGGAGVGGAGVGRAADRLRVIVCEAGAGDPLRYDTSPSGVVAAGRRLISAMVDGLPPRGPAPAGTSIAARLGPRLGPLPGDRALVTTVNAVLVCMADHELAASTFAARVAASVRADPYSVVMSGLGVIAGPLHGGASQQVVRMLEETEAGGVAAVVGQRMRDGGRVPGLGHKVYRQRDPRAEVILELASGLGSPRWEVVEELLALLRGRLPLVVNVDMALGALIWSVGLDPDAGETMFTVARVAGWLAHAIEEYGEKPVRFRPRAVYVGSETAGAD